MPKDSKNPGQPENRGSTNQPYTKTPLVFIHAPTERKILVPRLENYESMLKLAAEKIGTPDDVSRMVLKSSTVPGLDGEKVEISKELWPELVKELGTFEVDELKQNADNTAAKKPQVPQEPAGNGPIPTVASASTTRTAAVKPANKPTQAPSRDATPEATDIIAAEFEGHLARKRIHPLPAKAPGKEFTFHRAKPFPSSTKTQRLAALENLRFKRRADNRVLARRDNTGFGTNSAPPARGISIGHTAY
ncbi:unnamed protein product [Peniophora sp. CBMAI 1063]|nr:unnamed protein product [Peniophora sp. CBMAI 1063]